MRGEIRSFIGQAELLMAQRFKQFSSLIDNCEFKMGEKETTCTDLQGFWEMIYCQVCVESIFVCYVGYVAEVKAFSLCIL